MVFFVEIIGLFYLGVFIWFWFAYRSTLRRSSTAAKRSDINSNLIPFERGVAIRVRNTQRAG
ncbi:hypothetical protein C7378_0537 [Acidipila rosea]|uniref:Uncharacterized protein n=1 Tax=Acidipila rosea TaxID=768535 RepID=A0A4R1LB47_9BACT|nr:hypothetical protein C7378_0537 [Acidipila rosea]